MEILLGAIGGVLTLMAYLAGVLTAGSVKKPTVGVRTEVPDDEAVRKKREALLAQQKAFQAMQAYNAETAYGIKHEENM